MLWSIIAKIVWNYRLITNFTSEHFYALDCDILSLIWNGQNSGFSLLKCNLLNKILVRCRFESFSCIEENKDLSENRVRLCKISLHYTTTPEIWGTNTIERYCCVLANVTSSLANPNVLHWELWLDHSETKCSPVLDWAPLTITQISWRMFDTGM